MANPLTSPDSLQQDPTSAICLALSSMSHAAVLQHLEDLGYEHGIPNRGWSYDHDMRVADLEDATEAYDAAANERDDLRGSGDVYAIAMAESRYYEANNKLAGAEASMRGFLFDLEALMRRDEEEVDGPEEEDEEEEEADEYEGSGGGEEFERYSDVEEREDTATAIARVHAEYVDHFRLVEGEKQALIAGNFKLQERVREATAWARQQESEKYDLGIMAYETAANFAQLKLDVARAKQAGVLPWEWPGKEE